MTAALDRLHEQETALAAAWTIAPGALRDLHALRKIYWPDPEDEWARLSVWVAAPVLAGFSQWLTRQAEKHADGRLRGVMREGRFLCRLMQKLSGAPAQEIWLNRRLSMLAAFGCGDDEALLNWLARTRLQPLTGVEAGAALGAALPVPDHAVIDLALAQRLLAQGAFDRLREQAAALADRLLRHWRHSVEAQSHTLLMDFACAGNIQRSLRTILAAKGQQDGITGLNFLTTQGSRWAMQAGCAMHGYLAETGQPETVAAAYARAPELIEVFAASPLGTLQDYAEDGAPVCGPSFLTAAQQNHIHDMQNRVLEAADIYRRELGAALTAELGRCVWGRLLLHPSAAEAETLGDWPIDTGLDGAAPRRLAPPLSGDPVAWTRLQTAWPAGSLKRNK